MHSEKAQLAIVRVEPSCFSEGRIRITAAARFNGVLYTESREEPIPALTHSRSLPYEDNEIAATCLEDGSYEEKMRWGTIGSPRVISGPRTTEPSRQVMFAAAI